MAKKAWKSASAAIVKHPMPEDGTQRPEAADLRAVYDGLRRNFAALNDRYGWHCGLAHDSLMAGEKAGGLGYAFVADKEKKPAPAPVPVARKIKKGAAASSKVDINPTIMLYRQGKNDGVSIQLSGAGTYDFVVSRDEIEQLKKLNRDRTVAFFNKLRGAAGLASYAHPIMFNSPIMTMAGGAQGKELAESLAIEKPLTGPTKPRPDTLAWQQKVAAAGKKVPKA